MFFVTVFHGLLPPYQMMEVKPSAAKITQGLNGHTYCSLDDVLLCKSAQRHRRQEKWFLKNFRTEEGRKTFVSVQTRAHLFLFFHQRTNKDTVQCVKIQLEGRMWNSMSLCKGGR